MNDVAVTIRVVDEAQAPRVTIPAIGTPFPWTPLRGWDGLPKILRISH